MNKTMMMLAGACLTVSASAAILFEDGFDYSVGNLPGGSGGTGFSNNWTGANNVQVVAHNWGAWTGYAPLSTNRAYQAGGAGQIDSAFRNLSSPINADSDQTLYISFTINGGDDSANNFSNFSIRNSSTGSLTAQDANTALFSYRANAVQRVAGWSISNTNTTASPSGAAGMTAGNDYLFIGMMDFNSGSDDSISFTVVPTGTDVSSVPTWDITNTFDITSTSLNQLAIRTNGDVTLVGNIRVGTTYASVIPEPGTFALLGLAGAALLLGLRKRR